jgi:hypothetical protein
VALGEYLARPASSYRPDKEKLPAMCTRHAPSHLFALRNATSPCICRASTRALPLLLLLCMSAVASVEAQSPTRARNAIFGEAFGNALVVGSINYERSLAPSVTARVGFNPFGPTLPLMLNRLQSLSGNHWAEAGLGVLIGAGEDGFATATIGYRYQGSGDVAIFRATLTPLLGRGGTSMWSGISFGVAF